MHCQPVPSTSRLLHNMDVIMKPFNTGCRFLFDTDKYLDANALLTLFSNESLSFILHPGDSKDFYNYTRGFSAKKQGAMLFEVDQRVRPEGNNVDMGYGTFTAFDAPVLTDEDISEIRFARNKQIPAIYKVNTDRLLQLPETGRYQLKFKSIRTYIKYYLLNYNDIDNLKIADVEEKIEFSQKEEQLDNGRLAQVFTSTQAVVSMYQSARHFQLVDTSSATQRVIMDYMPLPKPGHYFTEQIAGERVVVSEVFIN
ncbi:hypothetical protein MNBD_GAMMA10-2849 [hydrothermal vent metagenome]|uniref:Uncharacterized protein n=1 Tax=hydrothermal vent metagenome TaxID=652676 RepID=A0A3B0Y8L7_9ZZZZ